MERNAINQTRLVHSEISMRDDFKVSSPAIDGSEAWGEHCPTGYDWYLVETLDGTEEHVATCLGSTWVGVRAA